MTSDEPASTAEAKPKTGAPRKALGTKPKKGPSRHRAPPRPHRKLEQEVLDSRISKLRKRIERTSGQLADAKRHIEGYDKEMEYRAADKEDGEKSSE